MTPTIDNLTDNLFRQYPKWPSTFGPCATPGCANGGRGCGPCAECITNILAQRVGRELADEFHESVKRTHELWHQMRDHVAKNEE